METSLLTTKLYIPPARPGLVARPRLIERLRSALSCALTLVSAPAGFGKTTLVSEWVRQNDPPTPTAWLSLDEEDNDPVRFWDYFVAALKTLQPATGEGALALLHSTPPPPIESVLTTLINDLTAIPEDFAFVLDDYHFIKSEPIHAGIAFLLDHLPPRMHLVIATREDPPLPLSHFRGRGTMLEVGADDLRFTQEEAAGLLKQLQGPELSIDDVKALNTRAEGWAVGLKMAALSLGQRKDVKSFIAAFAGSHRYIMDYLIEEVLKRQSVDVQDFLLQTSVLERLTAPLCDSLTGRSDSQDMLSKLERANLFIVPLDESRQWYRYHQLFAELLQHRLEVVHGTREVPLLHQRASQWYEEHSLPDDAIHHALVARDWERAVRLLYDPDEKRIQPGQTVTLLNWLKAVPEEVLRAHPRLYSQFALVLGDTRQFDAAEAVLGYLEQTALDDANLQGEIAITRANIAQNHGDFYQAAELSRKALSLLAPDNLRARSRACYLQGFMLWERGLFKEAEPLLTEAYEGALQLGDHIYAGASANFLAAIVWQRGRLRRADELWRHAIGLAEYALHPLASLSNCILYEWNDLEAAARAQQQLIELSKLTGSLEFSVIGYFFLAQTRRAQGDIAGTTAAIEMSDELAQIPGVARYCRARHAAFRAMLAIWQDDPAATAHWRTQVLKYVDVMPFWLCHVPYRIMIACGEKEAAAEQLEALHERAAQDDLQTVLIRTRVCQTLAAPTPAEALTFLAEALKMGQPEGFIRTFVDEGRLLAPLLRKALSQGITPEYTGKLLNIIEAEERQRRAMNREATPSVPPPGPLSERELEVLRLMAAGLSNRQIAEKLFITTGTVKSHVHNIIEKLYAQGRTQAISQARDLKLI